MSRIQKLPPHLADLIAAGEVVERPASVIKELFENSVDAGATSISVEINNGGMTMMRVTDNGIGIPAEDVELAFLRHATSKLATASDLEAIGTLGFRGEALAAISSVSRVELITRTESATDGVRVVLEGGEVVVSEPFARPRGTTITVRDLFYNTPARQKFMKTDRAEASAILQAVVRLALSRPDIAVRYVRDGNEELRTTGDGSHEGCVYSALGRDFSAGMLPFELTNEGVRAHGFASKVEALRGNRNNQFFFVNGRAIKSKSLQAALEQAYRNRMFAGRYPSCVIYIELGTSNLDVNVHPSKTEVKFLFEKHVFDAVHYGTLSALDGIAGTQHRQADAPRTPTVQHQEPRQQLNLGLPPLPITGDTRPAPPQFAVRNRDSAPRAVGYAPPRDTAYTASPRSAPLPIREPSLNVYATQYEPQTRNEGAEHNTDAARAEPLPYDYRQDHEPAAPPEFRVIGEAMLTYIVVECGESLWLIDKHAAHERIHFDRLRAEAYAPMMQSLLAPIIIAPEEPEALLENAELLETLGFSVEDFGGGKLAVRQIPEDINVTDTESVLSDICRELTRGGDFTARRDEVLASVACKAAIKSGSSLTERELYTLAESVMRGDVKFCPHGRPVAFEMTKSFIDKSFKRI